MPCFAPRAGGVPGVATGLCDASCSYSRSWRGTLPPCYGSAVRCGTPEAELCAGHREGRRCDAAEGARRHADVMGGFLQEHTKKLQATNEWREAKQKEERKKRCVRDCLTEALVSIRHAAIREARPSRGHFARDVHKTLSPSCVCGGPDSMRQCPHV